MQLAPISRNGQDVASKVWPNLIEPSRESQELLIMLGWAVIFLIVAIIAAIFGFGGIAGTAAGIAQILFYIFVAIFLISLLVGLFTGKRP